MDEQYDLGFWEQVADSIEDAATLLSGPDNWCEGSFAVDELGIDRPYWHWSACAWCLDGAILRAVDAIGFPETGKFELRREARKLVADVIRSCVVKSNVFFTEKVMSDDKSLIHAANDSSNHAYVKDILGAAHDMATEKLRQLNGLAS